MGKTNLTDEQASKMLAKLADYYGQPVMPVSVYCRALETWASCISRLNFAENAETWQQGYSYFKVLNHLLIDIKKSNLLARLIYGGEKLRTKECPEHKGHWSGLSFPGQECPHGCDRTNGNYTGWLPEE